MRDLADNPVANTLQDQEEALGDLSLERFLASLDASLDHREGLFMTAEDDI